MSYLHRGNCYEFCYSKCMVEKSLCGEAEREAQLACHIKEQEATDHTATDKAARKATKNATKKEKGLRRLPYRLKR